MTYPERAALKLHADRTDQFLSRIIVRVSEHAARLKQRVDQPQLHVDKTLSSRRLKPKASGLPRRISSWFSASNLS